jgi:hypothetical protein
VIRLISNASLWHLHVAQGRADAVRDWARANGIDPNAVPVDADMTIEDTPAGRIIRYVAYLLTDDGDVRADPFHDGQALREQRVVPLVVGPPPGWPVYVVPEGRSEGHPRTP